MIYDKKLKGKICIIKSDIDSNIRLKDAFLEIYKEDELIYSGYTNEEGKIEIDNLDVGNYIIKETIAPSGYLLEQREYMVEINNDNFDIVVEIKNKHEEINVPNTGIDDKINFSSNFGIMLVGFVLIIFSKRKKIFK